jgi:16S rRNA processing protein RimM
LSKKDTLPIGKITGVHGIKGEIKVAPYGDLEGLAWNAVYIADKEGAYRVARVRRHKGIYLVELEGVSTRNDAEALTGREVSVLKEDVPEPPEDEYYYFDLIGMDVWTDDGRFLGPIINIIATGSNDVFEIKGPLGEVLVPATVETVLQVSVEKKKVTVHLLQGLLPGEQ